MDWRALATGDDRLAIGWFFDTLSGDQRAGLNVWTVLAVLAATEGVRMAVFFGAVNVWDYNWNLLQMLMHSNMLAWIVEGAGAVEAHGTLASCCVTARRCVPSGAMPAKRPHRTRRGRFLSSSAAA